MARFAGRLSLLIALAALALGRGHVRGRAGPRARVGMTNTMGVSPCVIRVLGVGGGGSNAISRIMRVGDPGVECFTINTDAQALEGSTVRAMPVQIGRDVTRGLGAGGNPAIGRLAAEESREEINNIVSGSDLVFVVAGMGGGTGSGAAPIVAQCAKAAGCLTIGVVTRPFAFEGARRMRQAVEAIAAMRDSTDALLVVSNDKLLASAQAGLPINQAFEYADDILRQGVTGNAAPAPARRRHRAGLPLSQASAR
jgi:cell division protein FtsZ